MSDAITNNPWLFACEWYKIEHVHKKINIRNRHGEFGSEKAVPVDVKSREFAEWLTNEYRLAMQKGAELAISEMMEVSE
jgi:hypothetical protein